MKKIIVIGSALLLISNLVVSCKKDRVCQCNAGSTAEKITLIETTKRQAKDACVGRSYDMGNGIIFKIECELK